MKRTKNAMIWSTVLALVLAGCGGGGGGENEGGGGGGKTKAGTARYLDSAVEGLHYRCGGFEGETDANGSFRFRYGASCSFGIGGVALGTIGGDLIDGQVYVPGDPVLAQFLQSLDEDADPSNGIVISPRVRKYLSKVDLDIRAFYEEYKKVLRKMKNLGLIDKIRSESEALKHLARTYRRLFAPLAGRTLYFIAADDDGNGYAIEELSLSKSLDRLTVDEGEEKESYSLKIGAKGLEAYDDAGELKKVIRFVEAGRESALLESYDYDSASLSRTYYYYDEATAKKILHRQSGKEDFRPVPISLSYFKGKKLLYNDGDAWLAVKTKWNDAVLHDGREEGDGPVTVYQTTDLTVWPGKEYEYRVEFGGLPREGTWIKVSKEGGKDVYFTQIDAIDAYSE